MKAAREFVAGMAEQVSMPEVYAAIRELLLDPDSAIDDFVEVVQRDSMLAVRVMRMARSQYFGFPRRCENLHQAIGLIGLMQLHDLLLGTLCMRTYSGIPEEVLDLRSYWRYCVQCGIAARAIGRQSGIDSHFAYFSLGLLHEIGHAALFLKAPEASLRALDASRAEGRDIGEVERELFGFGYGDVGAELMRLWHLPPVYRQVAEFHREPEQADEEFTRPVRVVHLAHTLCQDPGAGARRELVDRAIAETPQFERLPPDIDAIVIAEVEANTDTVLELLWPRGAQDLELVAGRVGHA